jgi:phenylalanyl-tRNA synthetase alpha chain
MVEASPEMTDE